MNPLVKKEIRLLLPAWIVAVLLAVAPVWLLGNLGTIYYANFTMAPDFCFAFGAILLGIASFGQEFSSGAFTLLLSQPVERRRFWLVKTVVLAGAFVFVFLAYLVSRGTHFELYDFAYYLAYYHHLYHAVQQMSLFWGLIGWSALYAVAFLSGGLWATLLFRRMSEAFWVTLLAPPAIMTGVGALLGEFITSTKIIHTGTTLALALYSVAGFFWARRLFLRAQDVQWMGGEIAFSARKRVSQPTAISNRPRHWLSALAWKELQLHQVNILIAVLVFALDLMSVIIRKFHPHFADPNVQGLLELVWVLWLLMPLLIGSAAVAEEHRIGIVESQLCLPVSRRVQFTIKFLVGLILSLVLGGAMPFVIERARDFNDSIFIVAAVIFFISFYASTVSRMTLQAIGLAIVVATGIYFYAVATAVRVFKLGHTFTNEVVGIEFLKLYLGVPILVLVLTGLMYWNFKRLHPIRKLRWRNFFVLLAVLAFISLLTHAVYFRVWEFLTPIEPPHGPARLSASAPPMLLVGENAISVRLPDGKLWTEEISSFYTFNRFGVFPRLNTQRFIGGSNWTHVAAGPYRIAGIQSDGSLWTVQNYPERLGYPLTRIGSGTNWSQVAGGLGFLLLKKDGTLWFWGADKDSLSPENLRKYLTIPPVRISKETNWVDVFGRLARRRDGSVWISGFTRRKTNAIPQLEKVPNRREWMSFRARTSRIGCTVEVNTNNELWFIAPPPVEDHQLSQKVERFQLAKNRRWITAVFATDDSMIALRSDGTLWKWPPFNWVRKRPFSAHWTLYPSDPGLIKPVQIGTYSGWIALHPLVNFWPGGVSVTLAADGSLWAWGETSRHVWLAPSRKPVYFGNIFQGQKK